MYFEFIINWQTHHQPILFIKLYESFLRSSRSQSGVPQTARHQLDVTRSSVRIFLYDALQLHRGRSHSGRFAWMEEYRSWYIRNDYAACVWAFCCPERPFADRIGGKKAFLFGAIGVASMNFLFGLAGLAVISPAVWEGIGMARHVVIPASLKFGLSGGMILTLMAIVWGLNGFFQSFGALSIVKVNAQWFHVRERGTFTGIFGVLIRLGLLLAFQGVPLIILFLPWQYAFWIPGACVLVLFVINYYFMHNSPQDAGLSDFETGDAVEDSDGKPSSVKYVLSKVFASRVMWMIALGSMMIGFVRRSVVDAWWPKYFVDFYGADKSHFATYLPLYHCNVGNCARGYRRRFRVRYLFRPHLRRTKGAGDHFRIPRDGSCSLSLRHFRCS